KKGDLYKLRNWTAYSAKNAKKIFTISNSSKNDIINEYNVPDSKVVVTYPGIKSLASAGNHQVYPIMNKLKEKYGISEHFILFVGTLQPRKNIVRLIEAYSRIISNIRTNSKIDLVVIGKKGWMYEEILQKPKDLGIEDRV